MKRLTMPLISFLMITLMSSALTIHEATAQIYKYRDENGAWHFTDSPDILPEETETINEAVQRAPGLIDVREKLEAAFNPQNEIERASLATVSIQSTIGFGSGFFITDQGHIVTNRHVLQYTQTQEKKTERQIGEVDLKLKKIEADLSKEEIRLETLKEELNEVRHSIDEQKGSKQKKMNESRYRSDLEFYQSWKEHFDIRKAHFESQKKEFQEKRFRYKRESGIAALSRSFAVCLADNTKVQAYLVNLSNIHDLALLKIDGYKTPYLQAAPANSIAQGEDVYAIGNPVQLKNSVAKGIFSGFEGKFAKTDAKIYPGNSGGPLVTNNGRVIGVNTFKELTHKFEGLGFALKIQHVITEFDNFLP